MYVTRQADTASLTTTQVPMYMWVGTYGLGVLKYRAMYLLRIWNVFDGN